MGFMSQMTQPTVPKHSTLTFLIQLEEIHINCRNLCHYNIRKYSFCARVVNMWNSLPSEVVEAVTVKSD